MKNAWKGLVVGGLTGVGAGLIIDAFSSLSDRAESAGRTARRRAPELMDKVKEHAPVIAGMVMERERAIADKVRERAPEIADKVRERAPEIAEKVKERAPEIAGKVKDVDLREAAQRAADKARSATKH
jgi:hypothetical protein